MALILMMHDLIVDLYQKIMFVNGFYLLLHKKDSMVKGQLQQPRSNSPARKRLVPGNSGDFVEAVFRPEMFQIFSMLSVHFLQESTGSSQESAGKIRTISGRNTASMFQRFSVFSCRMPQDPVPGIIDLGGSQFFM
jgi:hypothetical protein